MRGCKNTEEFVQRAILVHGNKYTYSNVVYTNSRTKVSITCPIHGEFLQAPYQHLDNHGCPKCRNVSTSKRCRIDTAEFIRRSNKRHGNRYGYDRTEYVDSTKNVIITCAIHGDFSQKAGNHLNGQGCPVCGRVRQMKKAASTKEKFTTRAIEVHGDKYDYSLIEYVNNNTKICIKCRQCGNVFWQAPNNHLAGQGCSSCASSKGATIIENIFVEQGIPYMREFWFSDCRDKYPLRFDFSIYLNGKQHLIEYDGEQHFVKKPFFDKHGGLLYNRKHDDTKNKYCKDNNIKLIRIPYNRKVDLFYIKSFLN